MQRADKPAGIDKQKRQAGASEKDNAARPKAEARAWPSVNQLQGKKIPAGRKVPNGPVGGSGRKTNLSRSS